MTISLDTATGLDVSRSRRHQSLGRFAWSAVKSLPYCLALIPVAVAVAVVTLFGQVRTGASWWYRLSMGRTASPPAKTPGFFALMTHTVLSVVLGAAALVPLGMEALLVLRGVFYGFVDRGPYDTSWGGPTRAGAWLAHFAISIPFAVGGLLVLTGLAAMHRRRTEAIHGGRRAGWVIPATLLIAVGAGMFFVAWLHQLPS